VLPIRVIPCWYVTGQQINSVGLQSDDTNPLTIRKRNAAVVTCATTTVQFARDPRATQRQALTLVFGPGALASIPESIRHRMAYVG
jgi:hypothetical protein